MRLEVIPGRGLIGALAAGGVALGCARIAGLTRSQAAAAAAVWAAMLVAAAMLDYFISRRAWRESAVQLHRRLPSAFAIGVKRTLTLTIALSGSRSWHCRLRDHTDPSLAIEGLPITLTLAGGRAHEATYTVTPTRRGEVGLAPAAVRVRSRWGLCELLERLGSHETRRVYPDFAQVARYAWLAGDRRLQEIGIKTYQQRGEGTDFKELSEYRIGDSVRHIDWKATLRLDRPIVRQFQDERDQAVVLLIDCGRRMRADERQGSIGTAHFDQVLNAVMLLSYVALKQGDAVGAMTFGTPEGAGSTFAPRKGLHALDALMAELYDVQATPTHSDYVMAAQTLLRRFAKRALVIVITNFRDEDCSELGQALKLLRSRHLVLLASLRETVVRELIAQPLLSAEASVEVASAHLYEQGRRDAFNRIAARDALMLDAEPEQLGIELVNRYHAVKRAGLI